MLTTSPSSSLPEQMAALRDQLTLVSGAERRQFYQSLSEEEGDALFYNWAFWARPEQLTPAGSEWDVWMALAGRGWGKTRTGAEWVHEIAEQHPGCRIALIGRIPKDVRRVMVEGESGILACAKPWFMPLWNKSLGVLTWPNGSQAFTFSSEVPDDLRGPQFHFAWLDEWAKFRFPVDVWDMLWMCLRLGQHPRCMVTTTPRPLPILRTVLKDAHTVISGGSTYDNQANLPASFMRRIREKYEGTTLGAQELHARLLDESPGALWTREMLDKTRVKDLPRDEKGHALIRKAVLGVDPSVSSNDESAETGIVLDAIGIDGHGYCVNDYSDEGGLDRHALEIVMLWKDGLCDLVVAEKNQGGDLVENTLRMVRDADGKQIGRDMPFKGVTATKGKRLRAEPVQMIYQQQRFHHVGQLADLEDQMCTWVPDQGLPSPDRLDAHVWAATELLVSPDPEVRIRRL